MDLQHGTYTAERNGYSVTFEISPSYSTLKVSLAKAEHELAAAEVTSFTGLEIETDGGRVTLVARLGESAASALHLTLEPRVRLSFVASSDS